MQFTDTRKTQDCVYFLQGRCTRLDCPFLHDPAKFGSLKPAQPSLGAGPAKLPMTCKFFLQGRCTKGALCEYRHDIPGMPTQTMAGGGMPQQHIMQFPGAAGMQPTMGNTATPQMMHPQVPMVQPGMQTMGAQLPIAPQQQMAMPAMQQAFLAQQQQTQMALSAKAPALPAPAVNPVPAASSVRPLAPEPRRNTGLETGKTATTSTTVPPTKRTPGEKVEPPPKKAPEALIPARLAARLTLPTKDSDRKSQGQQAGGVGFRLGTKPQLNNEKPKPVVRRGEVGSIAAAALQGVVKAENKPAAAAVDTAMPQNSNIRKRQRADEEASKQARSLNKKPAAKIALGNSAPAVTVPASKQQQQQPTKPAESQRKQPEPIVFAAPKSISEIRKEKEQKSGQPKQHPQSLIQQKPSNPPRAKPAAAVQATKPTETNLHIEIAAAPTEEVNEEEGQADFDFADDFDFDNIDGSGAEDDDFEAQMKELDGLL